MMLQTRVNDIYKDWKGSNDKGGFFYFLNYYATEHEIEIPFLTNVGVLDLTFHGNFSGNKLTSPLLDDWYDEEFFDAQAVKLAEAFWKLEGERLLRMWETYNVQYNPIWNYDMHTHSTDDHTGTDTHNKNGKETSKTSGAMLTTSQIEGLDSSTFQDSERSETKYGVTKDGSTLPLESELSFTNRNDEMVYGSTHEYDMTRQGNIGVKTQQEMLREDIEFWKWNFYYQVLFPAVDRLIATPIY